MEGTYTKDELQALANTPAGVFASNPAKQLFATADGQYFTDKGNAEAHRFAMRFEQPVCVVTKQELAVVKEPVIEQLAKEQLSAAEQAIVEAQKELEQKEAEEQAKKEAEEQAKKQPEAKKEAPAKKAAAKKAAK